MSKLTSRKFWICIGAALASLGTSIASMHHDNEIIAAVGLICTFGSAAIYAAAEAYVDGNRKVEIAGRSIEDDRSDDAPVVEDFDFQFGDEVVVDAVTDDPEI